MILVWHSWVRDKWGAKFKFVWRVGAAKAPTRSRIIDEQVVWVVQGQTVSGGKTECEVVDFKGNTKSVNCEVLWQQVEDVAQQYGWTVNPMSAHLISGHSLKGQAKEVL